MFHWSSLNKLSFSPSRDDAADLTEKLLSACSHADLDQVKCLLGQNGDPNQPDKKGLTPLSMAAIRGDASIVRLLLIEGANPNFISQGKSPLCWASVRGHFDAVHLKAVLQCLEGSLG